ncbi:(2Fe-2S)-binding protein [Alphaproteobacteria bacterium]|nr:(2Fe-2S)-binding protein [Alphaproteobacteria bacterium]MDB4238895.1 (2Fe-2S)-binding protein [Alphaproteobacteria bacterium]
MIICSCNIISDKAISSAIIEGADSVSKVYKCCGAKPQCGSCAIYIKEVLTVKLKNIKCKIIR